MSSAGEFVGPDLRATATRFAPAPVERSAGQPIRWATFISATARCRARSGPATAGCAPSAIEPIAPQGRDDLYFDLKSRATAAQAVPRGGADRGHCHPKSTAFSDPICLGRVHHPSGDEPKTRVIAEIGDQDRGHMLLCITPLKLTAALRRHVQPGLWTPLSQAVASTCGRGPHRLYFIPALRADRQQAIGDCGGRPLSRRVRTNGRIHQSIASAVERGVTSNLLVPIRAGSRRSWSRMLSGSSGLLGSSGSRSERLPLHASSSDRSAVSARWLGSHNFNQKSLKNNAELLLRPRCQVVAALDAASIKLGDG